MNLNVSAVRLFIQVWFGAATACGSIGQAVAEPGSANYTLYRDSLTDRSMRIHIASFDAAEGKAYNRENCELAQQLFRAQSSVKTKFWCEPGAYRASLVTQVLDSAVRDSK